MNSSNSTHLFQLNLNQELRNFGFTYCIGAGLLPPLYFILMKTIYIKDRETPNFTYKLMNIINFTQLTQAIAHFLTGPVLIFPEIFNRYKTYVNIIGCTMNTFWIADFPMITLLAFSRILIFTNTIGTQRFPNVIKVIMALSWTWIAFVLVYGSITQNLIFVNPAWDYDFAVPFAELFSDLEIVLSFICLAISYFSYIFMAFLIYKRKSLKSSVNSRKNEIAILLQSTFVTTYITAMIFAWHQALFSMFSFIDMESKRNQGILNCCMIFHCYVNPTTMLICNKSIRQSCFKLLGIRQKKNLRVENPSRRTSFNPSGFNTTLTMH